MAEYNPGFAFYDTYYKAIEKLPLEQQMEICYAFVKYGITYEMVDPTQFPLGYAFVTNNKEHIVNSVERWINNQDRANFKADANMSRDLAIAQLISQNKKSKEIAEIISEEYGEISDSAVRKTEPWKQRNDVDFAVKWLGKNVNCSQNGTEKNVKNGVNVNSQERQNVKNSQKFTEQERENSQLLGAGANF